jgi:glyoxylase I family protein
MPIAAVSNHTGITVADIDGAIAFWRDVMGFDVSPKRRRGGPIFERITGVPGAEIDIAYVSVPGHTIELLSFASPADQVRSKLRPCDPGFVHFCFTVDDIDAVVRAVKLGGFEPVDEIQTVIDGPRKGARAIYTRSPDGVFIEFIQEPPATAPRHGPLP